MIKFLFLIFRKWGQACVIVIIFPIQYNLKGILKAHDKGMLKFPGELSRPADPHTFRQWLYHEVPKEWVVFSKPPFAGPGEVVKYIGRYTNRTAISNNCIIAEKEGNIEFWFKNTKKKAGWETTSLPVATFIERFLYHVLPKLFHHIRYYGILANGKAGATIETVRRDLAKEPNEMVKPEEVQAERGRTCHKCNKGTMITILIIDGFGNIITEKPAGSSDQTPGAISDSI